MAVRISENRETRAIDLPGYDIGDLLADGQRTLILRAVRQGDGRPVILKMLKDDFPAPAVLSRFRYEFELTRRLDVDGVIKAYGLLPVGRRLVMIMEDVGGHGLDRLITERGPALGNLEEALTLAVAIVGALSKLHQADVTHHEIHPGNILYAPDSGAIRLIDLGRATELSEETADMVHADRLDATLSHIAPEQTGRMNRTVDQRADLYSLGATLYSLFSGRAPFDDAEQPLDALGLIHAHIARMPTPLSERTEDLPAMLSTIVEKLMQKDAEDRYQSAFGVEADLGTCLEQLKAEGRILPFEPAKTDRANRLTIPEQLYGREAEVGRLLESFSRVSDGANEIVLVSGQAGIGKSVLVNEAQQPIAARHGYFFAGKFDQFLSDQPYSPFIDAFSHLVERLLTESGERIGGWRQAILKALGPNGQVIIEVIPKVELIIGPQPAVPSLPPAEARNRLARLFQQFIQVFVSADHPLVLFLDDVQWADGPSLTLMKEIASNQALSHLLLIAAFRDNEIDAAHPLSLTLEDLSDKGVPIARIELGPLSEEATAALIADTVRRSDQETVDLAHLCYQKTHGNPFFLNQFLRSLGDDRLITFSSQEGRWQWTLEAIDRRHYTDNVIDLVTARIDRLPENGQALLPLAACLGNQVSLDLLARLLDRPAADVADDLWPVLREKLLVPLTGDYLFAREREGDAENGQASIVLYRFLHDRVQQAAYDRIDEDEKRAIHLRIGRLFASEAGASDEAARGEQLFDLVNHLNLGAGLIEDATERRRLAVWNLEAGRRAKSAAAFEPAHRYLAIGLGLLPPDAWTDDYALALDMHVEAAEAAFLTHDFDGMAEYGDTIFEHAQALMDRVRFHDIELRALIAQDRRLEAIEASLPLLEELGAGLIADPKPEDLGQAAGAMRAALGDRMIADLIDLPAMTDERPLAAMNILCRLFSAAYFAAPQLLPLIIMKLVELSGRHGNAPESAFGYATHGLSLCAFMGEFDAGYQFGQLARRVLDKYDAKLLRARTLFITNICVTHWKEPIRATLDPLMEAYQSGLDTGDIEYSTHALMIHNQHLFAVGHDLADLSARMDGQRQAIIESKEDAALHLFRIYQQAITNWLGRSADPTDMVGDSYDEHAMLPVHQEFNDRTSIFHLFYNKMVLAYGFGRYQDALTYAETVREHQDGAVGVFQIPLFHVYDSLIRIAVADPENGETLDEMREAVQANQEKVKGWAEHCAANNLHRWHLVEAELAAIEQDLSAAIDHFEKAAELAHEHGYVQEEALAHERHALFWLGRNKRDIASLYLTRALYAYRAWGARAKIDALLADHGDLLDAETALMFRAGETDAVASARSKGSIDITSILKAAEALSGELTLSGLLTRMMQITMENAGAERGFLILQKGDRFVAAAGAEAGGNGVAMLPDLLVEALDDEDPKTPLCAAILNMVTRSGEGLVLDNAARDPRFETNAYVKRRQTKSVLCMPLRHKAALTAILYLENDLAQAAFTPERIELLNMLSAQMAVSIENAQFYDELLGLNRAYERFVPKEFLSLLGKDSIVDVKLGDQVAMDMTVMFLDIRDFTPLSESMTPEENFAFLNAFLGTIEPVFGRHQGFIASYTGDGLMALFPKSADDGVRCAIDVLKAIAAYNERRETLGRRPVGVGIGLHSGRLMLGTVGGADRMEGSVVSSIVNVASRVEQMNKIFKTTLLISDETLKALASPDAYRHRELGEVTAKGGVNLTLHEIFDADAEDRAALKQKTKPTLDAVIKAYKAENMKRAIEALQAMTDIDPADAVATVYLERCRSVDRKTKAGSVGSVLA